MTGPKPPSGPATAVVVLVLLAAAAQVVGAVVVQVMLGPLDVFGSLDAVGSALLFGVVTNVPYVILLAAGVVTVVWQVRASAFAIATAGPASAPPAWTAGTWLIPVVNLLVPPLLVHRLLRLGPGTGRAAGDVALLACWWVAWVGLWVAPFVLTSSISPQQLETFIRTSAWVTAAIWTVAALLFAAIVALVRQRQLRVVRTGT